MQGSSGYVEALHNEYKTMKQAYTEHLSANNKMLMLNAPV